MSTNSKLLLSAKYPLINTNESSDPPYKGELRTQGAGGNAGTATSISGRSSPSPTTSAVRTRPRGTVLIQPRLNRRHTVVAGDTLWKLAEDNYGDGGEDRTLTLVKMVAAANFIDAPDFITVGQLIYFPSFELGG